jgi:adenylate cyclase
VLSRPRLCIVSNTRFSILSCRQLIYQSEILCLHTGPWLLVYAMGLALVYTGKHWEAAESFKMAIRLDPFLKDRFGFGLARAYFHMYEYEKAAVLCEKAFKSNPQDYIPLYLLTASYGHLGREREAKAALAKLRELNPKWSYLRWTVYGMRYKNIEDFDFYVDGLRKAGMEYDSE